MLAAVVAVALHLSEERAIVRLAEHAQLWWLVLGVALQVATYWGQAESYRVVTLAAKAPLRVGTAFRLSLAKLFVDQALPSTGISGTVVVARELIARGLKPQVVMASVVVDFVGFHVANDLGLLIALPVAAAESNASALVVTTTLVFIVVSAAQAAAVLWLSGGHVPAGVRRFRLVAQAIEFLTRADPALARNVELIAKSTLFQLAVIALDVGTVWVLIRSLGSSASVAGVFASFMISTLLRTLSITPGGLGAFEAASTFTLKLAGVPLPVALSATLLFRGLSFWAPMLPGMLAARATPASLTGHRAQHVRHP
jgi:Mg2+-importing ATPase